jgi:hypothetical protein
MLQEHLSSPSRHEIYACQQKLSNDGPIAIGSVETDQGHLWWAFEVLQIGRDGSQRRGQFTAIVAVALACIRPDQIFACASLRAVVRVRTTSPRLRPR